MTRRLLLLIFLAAAIYLGSAFQPALLDDADAANAATAREMLERNDWVTMHMNGVRFLEKAPMMYWAIAASFKLFGVSTFTARLPLAIATILLVVVVYFFGRWMGGERAGFYAGLSLCVGVGTYLFTRILIFEVIVTLWITLAIFIFAKVYYEEWKPHWIYGFYACLAGAVLSKALIGVLFPLGILFFFVLMTNGWKQIWRLKPISGALLFSVLVTPWHVLAGMRNNKFFWFYFINEHVKRFLGTRYPMDYDTMPLLPFWFGHLVWLFPFSVFLPLVFWRDYETHENNETDEIELNRETNNRRSSSNDRKFAHSISFRVFRYFRVFRNLSSASRNQQLRLLAILWFLVIVGFFSFSTRQEYYTFPVFPALALLLGDALARGEKDNSKLVTWGQVFLWLLGLLVAVVLGVMLWLSRDIVPTGDISEFLTSNPENYRLSLGHASDLTTAAFAELRFPAAGAAITLGFGFTLAFLFRKQQKHSAATLTTALTTAVFFYFAHYAFGQFNPALSTAPLAKEIQARLQPNDIVAFNGEFQNHSSVGFYLARPVLLVDGRTTVLEFGSHYPDCPPVFIDRNELAQRWQGDQRVFLVTYDDQFEKVKSYLSGEVHRLAKAGGKSLYSNRP
ncbi:MAG TPA: glycosyltransferase family 39 protein [Blastocatellia bacterium]|nr:glycosyltransferase family 39 protein [Blastocatellia bacterium]